MDIHVLLSDCPVKVKCGNILILKTMGIGLYVGFAKAKPLYRCMLNHVKYWHVGVTLTS